MQSVYFICRFKLPADELRATGNKIRSCQVLSEDSSTLPAAYYEPPQYYYTPPYITARPEVSRTIYSVCFTCPLYRRICTEVYQLAFHFNMVGG